MVHYDPPTFFKLTKGEGEFAVPIGLIMAECPTAEHHSGIAGECFYLEVRKRQGAHLCPGRITFLITVKSGLPAATDGAAGDKYQARRPPVAIHIAVDIPRVPRRHLLIHDGSY